MCCFPCWIVSISLVSNIVCILCIFFFRSYRVKDVTCSFSFFFFLFVGSRLLSRPPSLYTLLNRIAFVLHYTLCASVVMLVRLYYYYYCYFEIPVFWSYVLPTYLFLYTPMIVSGFFLSLCSLFFGTAQWPYRLQPHMHVLAHWQIHF